MRFSQKMGLTPVTKMVQDQSIDDDLKNNLWNAVDIFVLFVIEDRSVPVENNEFYIHLWVNFFKKPIDTIPSSYYQAKTTLKSIFYEFPWYMVYDFIEFIASIEDSIADIDQDEFKFFCNDLFIRENSAYRFIDFKIAPITNSSEISEIEEVIYQSSQFTALRGANIHLQTALEKLSDKKAPDYRNSIKESISAVESVAKKISGKDKDSLGAALQKIKGKIKMHQALERGFLQIYGYASDGDGIRHGLMDESNCDFEDAKFMLVSCSAFINYLIVKAQKAGITFS